MKPGFIKRDGMMLRQTQAGETLYDSIRISDPEVIAYIGQEIKDSGLSASQVMSIMVTKYFKTQVKVVDKS